ncbi:AMED_5909 family protein [Amycolatopsis sp. WAC 04197]|uniref:AMED_5909 family protein n=1 Tax=Amycolatopsis sp. WAC 04197 TaxID=2203199 RepID=UPI00351638AF
MSKRWCDDVTSLEAADCLISQLYPKDGAPLEKLVEHSKASARVYRIVARLDAEQAANARASARRAKELTQILSNFLAQL